MRIENHQCRKDTSNFSYSEKTCYRSVHLNFKLMSEIVYFSNIIDESITQYCIYQGNLHFFKH